MSLLWEVYYYCYYGVLFAVGISGTFFGALLSAKLRTETGRCHAEKLSKAILLMSIFWIIVLVVGIVSYFIPLGAIFVFIVRIAEHANCAACIYLFGRQYVIETIEKLRICNKNEDKNRSSVDIQMRAIFHGSLNSTDVQISTDIV